MGNKLDHPSVEFSPGKVVMVTGANTGIGYETAKSLAERGAKVFLACRSEEKARAAIERMQTEYQEELQKRLASGQAGQRPEVGEAGEEQVVQTLNLDFIKLDLSSLQSTMDCAQEARERMNSLHVLVCNAGIAVVKQEYTADDFESHFQVNYLSHLLLTIHLLPLLQAGGRDVRIVLLSSNAHTGGKLDLENVQSRRSYSRFAAYSNSKAFMVMAAHFLARRLSLTGVTTYAVDPGTVDTEITQHLGALYTLIRVMGRLGILRTRRQGAATSVVASVDPELAGKTAVYLKNCRPASPSAHTLDESKQELLWNYSLECLANFLSDGVLRAAFPSAEESLLVIPKPSGPTWKLDLTEPPDAPGEPGSPPENDREVTGGGEAKAGRDESPRATPRGETPERSGSNKKPEETASQDDSAEPTETSTPEEARPADVGEIEMEAVQDVTRREAQQEDPASAEVPGNKQQIGTSQDRPDAGPAPEAMQEVRSHGEKTAGENEVHVKAEVHVEESPSESDSEEPASDGGGVVTDVAEKTVQGDGTAAEVDAGERAVQDGLAGTASEAPKEVGLVKEEEEVPVEGEEDRALLDGSEGQSSSDAPEVETIPQANGATGEAGTNADAPTAAEDTGAEEATKSQVESKKGEDGETGQDRRTAPAIEVATAADGVSQRESDEEKVPSDDKAEPSPDEAVKDLEASDERQTTTEVKTAVSQKVATDAAPLEDTERAASGDSAQEVGEPELERASRSAAEEDPAHASEEGATPQGDEAGPVPEAVEEVREGSTGNEEGVDAHREMTRALRDDTGGPGTDTVKAETGTEDASGEGDTKQKTSRDDSPGAGSPSTEQGRPKEGDCDDTDAPNPGPVKAAISREEGQVITDAAEVGVDTSPGASLDDVEL